MKIIRCIFFFKQKTAYEMRISDWSSDVCSSDLQQIDLGQAAVAAKDIGVALIARKHDGSVRQVTQSVHATQAGAARGFDDLQAAEIGRASCRDRVCQYV